MAYENGTAKRHAMKVVNKQPKTTPLSHSQIREVPCIFCGAAVGESCKETQVAADIVSGFHVHRVKLREKFPAFTSDTDQLSSGDKSLIVYYAYVMLCDSCEANSAALFNGKQFDSATIQRFFAQKAVSELKSAKLLG